ncbi:Sugar ABC transporter substrate-binding protein, partial [Dysosmobacter welbionis]
MNPLGRSIRESNQDGVILQQIFCQNKQASAAYIGPIRYGIVENNVQSVAAPSDGRTSGSTRIIGIHNVRDIFLSHVVGNTPHHDGLGRLDLIGVVGSRADQLTVHGVVASGGEGQLHNLTVGNVVAVGNGLAVDLGGHIGGDRAVNIQLVGGDKLTVLVGVAHSHLAGAGNGQQTSVAASNEAIGILIDVEVVASGNVGQIGGITLVGIADNLAVNADGHDLDLSEVHAVHVAVLQGDIAHELVQAIHGSAQQVLDGGLDLAVAHGLLIVAQLDPLRSRIPGSGQELTLGNRGIAHIRASLGFVVDHDAGGHAVIQDRAHLDHAGAEGALGIHVAQSLLQAVVAGVGVIHIIKLVALLVGQG